MEQEEKRIKKRVYKPFRKKKKVGINSYFRIKLIILSVTSKEMETNVIYTFVVKETSTERHYP